jgi:hypothetical protein
MRCQDRVGLVLHPGAVPDDLVAPRHQAAQALRLGVRNHTSGKNPAACNEASTPASILSILIRAWAIAFTWSGLAMITRAT